MLYVDFENPKAGQLLDESSHTPGPHPQGLEKYVYVDNGGILACKLTIYVERPCNHLGFLFL